MSAVSVDEANSILKKKNCARARYAISPLSWDWQLAADAAVHAERCIFAHASQIGKGPPVQQGENLSLAAGQPVGIDGWLNEEPNFSCPDNQCLRDQCGHWTQILWHNTTKVGCAKKNCPTVVDGQGKDIGFNNSELLVCRYSPPGNYIGQNPCTTDECKKGSKTSDCPTGGYQPVVFEDNETNRTATTSISSTVLQIIAFATAIVIFIMILVFVWLTRRYYEKRKTSKKIVNQRKN